MIMFIGSDEPRVWLYMTLMTRFPISKIDSDDCQWGNLSKLGIIEYEHYPSTLTMNIIGTLGAILEYWKSKYMQAYDNEH